MRRFFVCGIGASLLEEFLATDGCMGVMRPYGIIPHPLTQEPLKIRGICRTV